MSAPDSELARPWIEFAEKDESAMDILLRTQESPPETICFLAQQMAEKWIKAALAAAGVEPPRSHDLVHLATLAPPELELPTEGLAELTPHAVANRYPGSCENLDSAEAHRAADRARQVRSAVQRWLAR